MNGGINLFVLPCSHNDVNGMPMSILLSTRLMLNQKKICTSTGVPRKNQIYSQLTHDINGFGDSRITEWMAHSTTPTSKASAVNSRVRRMPRKLSQLNNHY